jgi:hypothetical protein
MLLLLLSLSMVVYSLGVYFDLFVVANPNIKFHGQRVAVPIVPRIVGSLVASPLPSSPCSCSAPRGDVTYFGVSLVLIVNASLNKRCKPAFGGQVDFDKFTSAIFVNFCCKNLMYQT